MHKFSTEWAKVLHELKKLFIELPLDFFDFFTEGEVELEVGLDFFDTVEDGRVVFDTNLESDFVGAHGELGGEEKHGDLAGVFDVHDARTTAELGGGEVVIFGDLIDDLLRGGGARLAGAATDVGGTILDELERC